MADASSVDSAGIVLDVRPPAADMSARVLAIGSDIPFSPISPVQRLASRLRSRSSRAWCRVVLRATPPALNRVPTRASHRATVPALVCAAHRAVEWASSGALLCAAVARVGPLPCALRVSRWPGRNSPLTRGAALRPSLRDTHRSAEGADARAVVGVSGRAAVGSIRGVIYRPSTGVCVGGMTGGYRARHTAPGSALMRAASSAWCHAEAGRCMARCTAPDSAPYCPRDVPRLVRRYKRVTCRVMRGVS